MSNRDKLIQKILSGAKNVTFDEAESLLLWLGFNVKVSGPHHVFRKADMGCTVSIKKRSPLFGYQIDDLREVLIKHGYQEK